MDFAAISKDINAMIQAKSDGYFELFLLELSTGMRRGEITALQ